MEQNVWNDGFFKIDPECHIIGNMEEINHFPGVQMWWRAIDGIMRPSTQGASADSLSALEPWEMQKSTDPENILRAMDKYGVDVACILPESMMDTTGYSSRWCTNGAAWEAVQTHPDRFIINPNLSPIKKRGVDNAIWELEYWVSKGAKIFKYYSPEDTDINDPALWPFYQRAEELGIVLCLHTGFCWVPPGKSSRCYPTQVDDVARCFPELKIVAFHMGYPFTDAMNMVAMGHPNVYLCLSLLVPWAKSAPYKFAHILGEAMRFVGPDRIIWGTDSAGYGAQIGAAAKGLAEFQMPEELQYQYGYLPLSDEDKRKIFGGNLGRLLGIDTARRRGGPDAATDTLNPLAGETKTVRAGSVKEQNRGAGGIPETVTAEGVVPGQADSPDKTLRISEEPAAERDSASPQNRVYDVVLSAPIGKMNGQMTIVINGRQLSGSLTVMNRKSEFQEGEIDEDGHFSGKGTLESPIGKMEYVISGTCCEDRVEAVARTNKGNLTIRSL